jgi:RpiB/LacA/LacB family sugar-phosphate isomerase
MRAWEKNVHPSSITLSKLPHRAHPVSAWHFRRSLTANNLDHRRHNDANIISIGQRLVPEASLTAIVDAWLSAEFEGGRHLRRIQKLDE